MDSIESLQERLRAIAGVHSLLTLGAVPNTILNKPDKDPNKDLLFISFVGAEGHPTQANAEKCLEAVVRLCKAISANGLPTLFQSVVFTVLLDLPGDEYKTRFVRIYCGSEEFMKGSIWSIERIWLKIRHERDGAFSLDLVDDPEPS